MLPRNLRGRVMPNEDQPEIVSHEDSSSSPATDAPRRTLLARIKSFRPEYIFPGSLQNKLGGFSRLTAGVLFILVAGGIGYGGIVIDHHLTQPKQHFGAKIVPFGVVSTSPQNGREDITNISNIVMEFNRPINPAALKGDFWIFPATSGTFIQTRKTEAVFQADTVLTPGTVYNIMIHSEFKSLNGSRLGADFHFKFTTATPDHSVIFNSGSGGYRQSVGSVQVGHEQIYTLSAGSQVDASGQINVYKADEPAVLDSLRNEASKQANGPNTDGLFMNRTIDSSNMTLVQNQVGITDGDQLKLNLPAGVYAIIATADNLQVGNTWLVVTDLGVALRQDDQKIVVAVSSLTSSQPIKADIKLYNFFNTQPVIAAATIDGVGEISWPYDTNTPVGWVVANYDNQFAIVPLNVQYSLADIRVNADLRKSTRSFGLTDKPTYAVGEKINFSGFVLSDNDVHYLSMANRQLKVYVAQEKVGQHLWDSTLTTDPNGRLSGSFIPGKTLLDSLAYPNISVDDSGNSSSTMVAVDSADFGIYVEDNSSNTDFISGSQLASFTLLRKATSSPDVRVQFTKPDYLSTEKLAAKITVRKSDGSKFVNGKITVHVYSQTYSEGQQTPPLLSNPNLGNEISADSIVTSLNENGQATVPVDVSSLPAGSSQVVTVEANITDDSTQTSSAGRGSSILHQGDGKISFGPTRGVVAPQGTLISRVYAKTLAGVSMPNAQIQYSLTSRGDGSVGASDSVIASGSVSSDANGLAQITENIGAVDPTTNPNLLLDVWTGDSHNNKIEAYATYYVQAPESAVGHSDLQLSTLDVYGVSTDVTLGQTLNLTVNSPTDIHALVAIDRGRIYKYETVDLKQGDNTYSVLVTPDMLPSFNLSFSYFSNGEYKVEGQSFSVSADPKKITVQIHQDEKTYKAGSIARFDITTVDSVGTALQSGLIVGIVDEKMFRLNDQPVGDISGLYAPRETTITSASSFTGRGSGFSGCGGGGNGYGGTASSLNQTGTSIYWNPQLTTATDGSGSIKVKLPKGTWRVFVYSVDGAVNVGSSSIDVTAK